MFAITLSLTLGIGDCVILMGLRILHMTVSTYTGRTSSTLSTFIQHSSRSPTELLQTYQEVSVHHYNSKILGS